MEAEFGVESRCAYRTHCVDSSVVASSMAWLGPEEALPLSSILL